jgi:hypothetical protein
MKCPTCFSIMKCISEIHKVPGQPGKERMDLHCFNRKDNDGRTPNICRARCHMGVITEDPKEWVCLEYSFQFLDKGKLYYLSSHNNLVDPYNQHRPYGTKTQLSTSFSEVYSLPYFIPLSTGDNMHEEAWSLFHKLRKLVIFS